MKAFESIMRGALWGAALWMLIIIWLIPGCSTREQIIEDPIFEENYIIYREDGCTDYLMQDPIFEENYILYRGDCK